MSNPDSPIARAVPLHARSSRDNSVEALMSVDVLINTGWTMAFDLRDDWPRLANSPHDPPLCTIELEVLLEPTGPDLVLPATHELLSRGSRPFPFRFVFFLDGPRHLL